MKSPSPGSIAMSITEANPVCTRGYRSERAAKAACRWRLGQNAIDMSDSQVMERLQVFLCAICGLWHVRRRDGQ